MLSNYPLNRFAALLLGSLLAAFACIAADETNTPADADTNIVTGISGSNTTAEATMAEDTEPSARMRRDAIVEFGRDAELKEGESAEAVVVIGGNARISGKVRDAVVAIGGDVQMRPGSEAQQAVAVLGNIHAEPGSTIHQEAVAVGGRVTVEEGATVHGHIQDVPVFPFPRVHWLKDFLQQSVFMLRPMAPKLGWAWGVAAVFFVFYLLVALVFPRPVEACVDELTRRPATVFAVGLITKLMLPLLLLILLITVVGIFVLPFVIAAIFLGGIIGKVAIIQWIGLSIGRTTSGPALRKPLVAFMLGFFILLIIYMIPLLGLLVFILVSIWGLGAAVAAAFNGMRREKPPVPPQPVYYVPPMGPIPPAPTPGVPPPFGVAPASISPGPTATGEPAMGCPPGAEGTAACATATAPPPPASMPLMPPVLPESIAFPKAGFWERIAAAFLDVVLVAIVGHFVGGAPLGFLVALAYFAGMWTWRGTTIGGIVLSLKVVRQDSRHLDFPVALVRALAAAFSAVVLFLGFLWIAWDPEKQGWHDKIAGTVVVRVPKAAPLLCL